MNAQIPNCAIRLRRLGVLPPTPLSKMAMGPKSASPASAKVTVADAWTEVRVGDELVEDDLLPDEVAGVQHRILRHPDDEGYRRADCLCSFGPGSASFEAPTLEIPVPSPNPFSQSRMRRATPYGVD